VGLAPHIDTHSAFGPTLLSVSLAGHAVMEFRLLGALQPSACGAVHADQTGRGGEASSTSAAAAGKDGDDGGPDSNRVRSDSDVGGKPVGGRRAPAPIRRASILLPPRSLLVLTGEARYRWQHYIPHRKRDAVAGEDECVFREPRRVSFTFRETREGACACAWPDGCDSRDGAAQVLKERARPGAVAAAAVAAAAATVAGASAASARTETSRAGA
jgi:alkylated DNA repair protein alkB family protein 8